MVVNDGDGRLTLRGVLLFFRERARSYSRNQAGNLMTDAFELPSIGARVNDLMAELEGL
jgi:hypothetical protein